LGVEVAQPISCTGDRIFEAPCLRLANRFASKTPTYVYRLRGGAQAITRDLPYGIMCVAGARVALTVS
jgi:carboxylesterase type B